MAITHGVLLPSAIERLDRDDRIKRLVISDTICQPEAIRNHPKITIVSVADLLAQRDLAASTRASRSAPSLSKQ